MTNQSEFSKIYWVEDTYLWEPGGWDYVAIGRVTDEQQLLKDGDNWVGSHDNYDFNCFETLQQALDSIGVRPSSVLWNESLTEKDIKTIREWVRENEPSWVKNNYAKDIKDVKDIVDIRFDNTDKAECDILLSDAQNKEVKCRAELPSVRAVFDKIQNEVQLYRRNEMHLHRQNEVTMHLQNEVQLHKQNEVTMHLQNEVTIHRQNEVKVLERIDEREDCFENLMKFACDSMYKYCCLYTEQDMRNFYTDRIKMDYVTKDAEEPDREIDL